MSLSITETTVQNILTRTNGYLDGIASHSLQPYRGCSYGRSLCGVGCYVQHNAFLLRGRAWGSFLDVRTNAAEIYLATCQREAAWAKRRDLSFTLFCSSATDPFVPQEARYRITRSLLEAMLEQPPEGLILQTHSHRVAEEAPLLIELARRTSLRIHVSIETDLPRIPGLPPHASSVEKRLEACRFLREQGLSVVVTVAPLLPIADPDRFFARIADSATAVVLDHFIGGDGSRNGQRTRQTPLPQAMETVEPESLSIDYLHRMVEVARRHLPGRVGMGREGFAGIYG